MNGKKRLTDYAGSEDPVHDSRTLTEMIRQMPVMKEKNLLDGLDRASGPAVYRISGDTALAEASFFAAPIVDDPFIFGQIVAAGALNRVYSKGGAPKLATAVICFPKELPASMVREIMLGSIGKLNEAGAVLAKGHAIEGGFVRFGISVTGLVDIKKIAADSNAKPGDVLILTKPVGSGMVTQALKDGRLEHEDALNAIESMAVLDKNAAEALEGMGVNACAGISDSSLAGCAFNMALASGVMVILHSKGVRAFDFAEKLAQSIKPPAMEEVLDALGQEIKRAEGVDENKFRLLFDQQASGGLLISVPKENSAGLLQELNERRVTPFVIGEVVEKHEGSSLLID